MARGLPDQPPEGLEFQESPDEHCPVCGWDSSDVMQDIQDYYNRGILLAIEKEDSPFSSMGGAQLLAYYIRCPAGQYKELPDSGDTDGTYVQCLTYFTVEEEDFTAGAMT